MLDYTLTLAIKGGDFERTGPIVEKEVVYAGKFMKASEGLKFKVDEKTIDNWVLQHKELLKNGIDVPLPKSHTTDSEERRGTVLDLYKKTDSKNRIALFAKLEFSDEETATKFKHTDVSLFSPPTFVDGSGNSYYRPITHIALTDYPVINDLDGFKVIAASLEEPEQQAMKMVDLAKALGIEGTDDMSDEGMGKAVVAAFSELRTKLEDATKPAEEEEEEEEEEEGEKKPAVAASLISTVRNARKTQIHALVKEGKITSAVGKELTGEFCTDKNLTLCLSGDGTDDGFDRTIDLLSKNEPALVPGEKTPGQGLKLSAADNPLIAEAERRAAAGG